MVVNKLDRICPVCGNLYKDNSFACSFPCEQAILSGHHIELCESYYRKICFRYHNHKCFACNETLILDVHHYDKNRKNNSPNNLIPICPTHHRYIHNKKYQKHPYTLKIKEQLDDFMENYFDNLNFDY